VGIFFGTFIMMALFIFTIGLIYALGTGFLIFAPRYIFRFYKLDFWLISSALPSFLMTLFYSVISEKKL
jgi:hypothetical protein